MQESADKIIDLILKSLRNEISDAEKKELDRWLEESPAYRQVYDELTNEHSLKSKLKLFGQVDSDAWWKKINEKIESPPEQAVVRPLPKKRWRYAVAVVIVMLAAAGVYYFFFAKEKPGIVKDGGQVIDSVTKIGPGGNYAVLVLADGKEIALKPADTGTIAESGNTRAMKLGDGQLAFENINPDNTAPAAANNLILKTPNGGQYSLMLPDGSKVWLNAASSIRYPGAFTAKERRVSITGEVYFDVKTFSSPFIVSILDKEGKEAGNVQVTGTKFNINAYSEESSIKATLVEGKVKVKSVVAGNSEVSRQIAPGQQAVINSTNSPGKIDVADHIDVNKILSWQRGIIAFDAAPFDVLMRQIGRWYDVQISYTNGIPNKILTGDVQRTDSLPAVLRNLQYVSGIRFRVEGRKVIVLGE